LDSADLQSLLLEVTARRAERLTPADVLRTYESSRFVTPSRFDARRVAALQCRLLEALPEGFAAIQLSPLAPLGCCSVLATVHPNKVVGTTRGHEVCADPTNSLALECAVRRRREERVRLGAFQRVVRAQQLPPSPGYYAHFGLMALTSAARWTREWAVEALAEHWRYCAAVLRAQGQVQLRWTDLSAGRLLGVVGAVRERCPELDLVEDPHRESGRGYYTGLCFKVYMGEHEVGDGGFTDWTQKLLGNRKEALLISGLGADRLV
jgi:hypothetical protein